MIDPQRIAALAQQPSPRATCHRRTADRALIVTGLHHTTDPLARPVAWSAAACTGQEGQPAAKAAMARVCASCPIAEACRTAFLPGAPVNVQQWRERLDGGQPLAA
ncbi:hypothetical protein [Streptomyces sp. NPDC049555]|uniref:hypothetical protein n=1 Tax=Streptomyces sp. NPDC049555 TaxID=3154930 RepID=UPI00341F0E33